MNLEMNEYEKMANEKIEKKGEIDCNLKVFFVKYFFIFLNLSAFMPVLISLNDKLKVFLDNDDLLIIVFLVIFSLFMSSVCTGIIALFYKLKKRKKLSKDKEYILAKEIIKKYNSKNYLYREKQEEEFKKKKLKDTLINEMEISERIQKMESFLKDNS